MGNVNGLRPTDSNRPELRQKKGRVVTQRSKSQQVGLAPAASPVSTYVRPMVPPEDQSLGQLADALSSIQPRLEKWAAANKDSLEKEQMAKLRYYTELFMKDKETGGVTAAQVKKVLPELVPTVAAKIADVTGKLEARKWVEGEIQGILEDDSVRLNTSARQEAIQGIRAKAMGVIGSQENDFYGDGFLKQLDASLGQYEVTWLQETAKHHEDVMKEGLSNEVLDTIMSGGDVSAIDSVYKNSSMLDNKERKEVIFKTYLDYAYAAGDMDVLDKIPNKFLNAEYKADIMKAKLQIQDMKWDQFRKTKELDKFVRTREIRQGKINGLEIFVRDGYVDPSPFRNQPQVYDYLTALNRQPRVRDAESTATATKLRTYVQAAGTTGDWVKAFANDPGLATAFKANEDVSMEALIDHVSGRTDLNPEEKMAFIRDIPRLMEGVNWMRDPDTTAVYRTVEKELTDYLSSIPGGVLKKMNTTPRSQLESVFYTTLRSGMNNFADEHDGKLPIGQEKEKIVDKANQAAEKYLTGVKADFKGQVDAAAANLRGVPSVDERKQNIERKKKEAEASQEYTTITVDGKEVKIPKRKAE